MATNYVQPGNVLTMIAPSGGIASGATMVQGTLVGIASYAADEGAEVEVVLEGVFEVAKATGQAWTQGAAVYWDSGNSNYTTTASGNTAAGTAAYAAASGDAVGSVRLSN